MQLDHDSGAALVITNNMFGCILISFPFGTNITGAWEGAQLPCRVLIQVSPQGITKKVETHPQTTPVMYVKSTWPICISVSPSVSTLRTAHSPGLRRNDKK